MLVEQRRILQDPSLCFAFMDSRINMWTSLVARTFTRYVGCAIAQAYLAQFALGFAALRGYASPLTRLRDSRRRAVSEPTLSRRLTTTPKPSRLAGVEPTWATTQLHYEGSAWRSSSAAESLPEFV